MFIHQYSQYDLYAYHLCTIISVSTSQISVSVRRLLINTLDSCTKFTLEDPALLLTNARTSDMTRSVFTKDRCNFFEVI